MLSTLRQGRVKSVTHRRQFNNTFHSRDVVAESRSYLVIDVGKDDIKVILELLPDNIDMVCIVRTLIDSVLHLKDLEMY